jgi:hypothetical protein
LNLAAAELGYPFAAALLLSCAGCLIALALLSAGRPGWGLAGLLVGEELAALSLATAALAHDFSVQGELVAMRLVAAALAVCLLSTVLRKALKPCREKAPAAP